MSYIDFTEEEHALIESVYSKVNTFNKKMFLAIIRANEGVGGWARVTIDEFSKATHVSQESIIRTLGTMQKHGILTVRKYKVKGSAGALRNEYKINNPDDILALHKAKQP